MELRPEHHFAMHPTAIVVAMLLSLMLSLLAVGAGLWIRGAVSRKARLWAASALIATGACGGVFLLIAGGENATALLILLNCGAGACFLLSQWNGLRQGDVRSPSRHLKDRTAIEPQQQD